MPSAIAPSVSNCNGYAPVAGSANCGRTAAKNTMVFGFVAPTTTPAYRFDTAERPRRRRRREAELIGPVGYR
ncbi:hypothetical protein AB0J47_11525 [Nocardia sp. NPDC049737]|uniref:hypothetical protein n=1 Tax=Nocardia sp. NPDC049737 TaxID=3154358 RepID=UPI003442EF61